jgi:chromosome segregation ATPase
MDGRMLEEPTMAGRSLTERVEIVERKMESLEILPAQMASLTGKVESLTGKVESLTGNVESLTGQVASLTEDVASLSTQFLQHRNETRAEFSATRTGLRGEIADLRLEMQARHEEAMSQGRMLYEDLKSTIATMHEGRRPPRRKP